MIYSQMMCSGSCQTVDILKKQPAQMNICGVVNLNIQRGQEMLIEKSHGKNHKLSSNFTICPVYSLMV